MRFRAFAFAILIIAGACLAPNASAATYDWILEKTATPTAVVVQPGEIVQISYTISAVRIVTAPTPEDVDATAFVVDVPETCPLGFTCAAAPQIFIFPRPAGGFTVNYQRKITASASPGCGILRNTATLTESDTGTERTASANVVLAGVGCDVSQLVGDLLALQLPQSLAVKLQHAGEQFAAGNIKTGCNEMNAFANEAAAQSGHQITAADARFLADAATVLRQVEDCR